MGNDIQLAIYLIVLLFPVFIFFLQEKTSVKKILYFLAFLLFLFIIILTGSRGAYLGIALGLSYFILLYPLKKLLHSLTLKFAFFGLMLIPTFFVYYANTHDVFPQFVQNNTTLYTIAGRLQLQQVVLGEPRFSTWKVGWEAIKAKPLLGYGPENFEVAFDEHYDPELPNIQYVPKSTNSWWDRAHNILIDTAVQAGIPALLLYLAFLGTLFWRLQKIKSGKNILLAHGLQATLIAYFGSLLFGFNHFSTLLAFFFLAAYILHITSKEPEVPSETPLAEPIQNRIKIPIIIIAVLLLLTFNWHYSLKPFLVNSDIQTAKAMVEADRIDHCEQAFSRMEKAIGKGSTFIDAYAKTTYFDVLRNCQTAANQTLGLAQKSRILLKEAAEAWPYHTRTWIFLGQVTTIIAERNEELSPQEKEATIKEAHGYFERAKELSPKRQEIYLTWTKLFIVSQDYEGMLKKAQDCIDLYPQTGECWFLKAIAYEFLGKDNKFRVHEKIALSWGYRPDKDFSALSNLLKAYLKTEDTGQIAKTYEKIVILRPEAKFYASLAFVYRELWEFAKARENALKVLELDPSTKTEVEAFLQTLP